MKTGLLCLSLDYYSDFTRHQICQILCLLVILDRMVWMDSCSYFDTFLKNHHWSIWKLTHPYQYWSAWPFVCGPADQQRLCIVENYSPAGSFNPILQWGHTFPNKFMSIQDQHQEDDDSRGLYLTRQDIDSNLHQSGRCNFEVLLPRPLINI